MRRVWITVALAAIMLAVLAAVLRVDVPGMIIEWIPIPAMAPEPSDPLAPLDFCGTAEMNRMMEDIMTKGVWLLAAGVAVIVIFIVTLSALIKRRRGAAAPPPETIPIPPPSGGTERL